MRAASRATGLPYSTMRRRLLGIGGREKGYVISAKPAKKKSLEEFREGGLTADTPAKIQSALDDLGETWMYENEFCTAYGINREKLAEFRAGFEDYVVTVHRASKRVWTGSKTMADEMRGML